jgi:EmrB/QacA subfamily drug resistance transporter
MHAPLSLAFLNSCDRGLAHTQERAATPHPVATLAATILGSSLAFIDGSVVNVALPAIARDLQAPDLLLSWTINAYLLPVGAMTLFGGAAGDRLGRRRLFLAGLVLFTAASILCAMAPTLAWLLAGRALQGFGAALLMPNSLALLGSSFEGEARGKAIGTWAAAGALSGAAGPLIGGWIVDAAGWRGIFFLNVPLAFATGFLAWRFVTESIDADRLPLDVVGAIAATLALLAITWALTVFATAASRASVWSAGAAGVVLLALFITIEHRRGQRAMLPPSLFRSRSFAGLNLLTFFLYASLGGLVVLLPFLLISVGKYSAVAAGAAMLPLPIVIGLASPLMGPVDVRYGARRLLIIGALTVAAGLALYVAVDMPIRYWRHIFPPTIVVAIGMGICVTPLTTAVMSTLDDAHMGVASGFNSAIARIAGLVATALLTFAWSLQGSPDAFLHGFREAAVVGAILAVVAAMSSFFMVADTRSTS